jgi:hypothetical protein
VLLSLVSCLVVFERKIEIITYMYKDIAITLIIKGTVVTTVTEEREIKNKIVEERKIEKN